MPVGLAVSSMRPVDISQFHFQIDAGDLELE
jgi:hypothetical protein